MDVVGPLTKTKSGNRYILTVIDLATRYPVAVALRRVDVQTTCTKLVDIFASYGVPEEIVHDNGGNFTAQLMEEVLGTMGIQQIRTSPYHPEANGAMVPSRKLSRKLEVRPALGTSGCLMYSMS